MTLPTSFLRTTLCASAVILALSGCSQQQSEGQQTSQAGTAVTAPAKATHTQQVHQQTLFDLSNVRIAHGPFADAQLTNVNYLLAMEPDRLLAPYLREAGIEPKSASYGNWENSGLDGHIGGHYLSALSLAWAATGDTALKDRLDYMLDQLREAQLANHGYLGGIPNGNAMWAEIKAGKIKADLFSLNDRWVPLYNIDKIFHGLRDAYQIAHIEQAKTMLVELGEWMLDITAQLSDEQIQQMLYSEYGGLNEVFADIAEITGDERFIKLARQFSHQRILKPLIQHKDELTGLHANTQIPKIIGILKVAEETDDKAWEDAATFFWETVTQHRSVSIGGNSVREHFHDSEDFTPMIEDVEGPETCNTYNMMKLSKMLFLHTGDMRYLDFYERATYNHILSSQHPQHGGLVYFTSMRPGHYRMYSSVEDSMWCCVGSGIENHSKYGELVYSHDDTSVAVNLFMPAQLNWAEKGVVLVQDTNFPDANDVNIEVLTDNESADFTLKVREPSWSTSALEVLVNGEVVAAKSANGYVEIARTWQSGDTVSFTLTPALTTEQLPDGQNYYSVLYGPVVMATKVTAFKDEHLNFVADDSRMGHIAAGPVCPPEALPIMLGKPQAFIDSLQRESGAELVFDVTDHVAIADPVNKNEKTTLIPFFRLHDSRYQVYWPQLDAKGFDSFVAKAKQEAAEKAALAAMTVDKITPGEQQPEVEHDFKGEGTRAGVNNGWHWRDATGYFEYQLKNADLAAQHLRITYFKGDVNRTFAIKINGEVLANVSLPVTTSEEDFYNVDYPLTDKMKANKTLSLRFEAAEGSVAGGIYGIRLINQ